MEKKLTAEEIQFIDTYLTNSDIHYDDIRIELVDHVASEIESRMNYGDDRDFYDIFKDYMIANKADMEKQGSKGYNWKILKIVGFSFLKNCYHWQVILGSFLFFWSTIAIDRFIYKLEHEALIVFPTTLILIIASIAFLINGKKKFSFVGNFGILLYSFFIINIQYISYLTHQSLWFYVNMTITSVFFVAGCKTMYDLSWYYKKRFNEV